MSFNGRSIRLTAAIGAVIALLVVASGVGAAVGFPFLDDVEDANSGFWAADSPWGRTTSDSKSPSTSWTDSPDDYYGSTVDVSLTMATPINLSTTSPAPQLNFYHHYRLESGFDFGYVEVSTAGIDGPWAKIATYSGNVNAPYVASSAPPPAKGSWPVPSGAPAPQAAPGERWVLAQHSLADYAGQTQVWVRFRVATDVSVVDDGWYLDDIAIGALPTAVNLSSTVSSTRSSLALSWSVNADADFASYRVYRSESPGVSFNDDLVANIGNQASSTLMDTGLPAKTTFYYRSCVVNNAGIYNCSNEVGGTTKAGLDYPFQDNAEVSSGNWASEPSSAWARAFADDAHSGNHVYTDSVGHGHCECERSFVLGDPIDINPSSVLVFHGKPTPDGFIRHNNLDVQVQYADETNWQDLGSIDDPNATGWTEKQVGLGNTTTKARVRFRVKADGADTNGWKIDDISISDQPSSVTLDDPVVQQPPDHDKIRLGWTTSTDVAFRTYDIYRSEAAGVSRTSTLVASITDRTATLFVDSGRKRDTTYYYKVYVTNRYGARSASNEANARTLLVGALPYPFSDDMESGSDGWMASGNWALTTSTAHTTSTSWTDSPNSDYPNSSDAYLEVAVNLGAAVMPVLDFWHRYSFQKYSDFGYVEVSTDDGSNWRRVYFVTGGSASWVNEKVDLAEYAGQSNVRIRFRAVTDSSGTADGWGIDDVSVAETTHDLIPYPFHDTIEPNSDPAHNWLTGSWDTATPGHDSVTALTDSPQGNYLRSTDTHMRIVLASTINLANAINPRLSFWHDYDFASIDHNRRFERDRGPGLRLQLLWEDRDLGAVSVVHGQQQRLGLFAGRPE